MAIPQDKLSEWAAHRPQVAMAGKKSKARHWKSEVGILKFEIGNSKLETCGAINPRSLVLLCGHKNDSPPANSPQTHMSESFGPDLSLPSAKHPDSSANLSAT